MRRESELASNATLWLNNVFRHIRTRSSDWHATSPDAPLVTDFFVHEEKDTRTLSEIFSQLPSPEMLDEDMVTLTLSLSGLTSTLYRYQKETLRRMHQQEMDGRVIPDPTYLAVHSIETGTTFYLQPSTMTVRRAVPVFSQKRSGILCEDMGSGKTVVLLALILATKGTLPEPELDCNGVSPIVTPLAARRFPWTQQTLHTFARNTDFRGSLYSPTMPCSTPPSLTELMLDYVRIRAPQSLAGATEETSDNRRLLDPLLANTPFYLFASLPTSLQQSRRSPRKGSVDAGSSPSKYFLTSATLAIVPVTLFRQWNSEIEKHCEAGALRCFASSSRDNIVPCASQLASQYDLVLLTHERFSAELRSAQNSDKPNTWSACSCPLIPGTEVPDCTCRPANLTPLQQCHWKRIVIDEGHSLSNHTSYLASLADLLRSDAVWIVSGTPTTNLIGTGFSEAGTGQDDFYSAPAEADADVRSERARERADLAKLEALLVHFLHLPQITQEAGSRFFRAHIAAPFLRSAWGAARVVEQMMRQCMVRHRIEDIEAEVALPPATKEVVMLDLHPLAAMTYNTILALVAGNAIDSERRDQDYFFHSNNRGALQTVMQNLSQSLFWHADVQDLHVDMDKHVNRAGKILQKATERSKSQDDIQLARDALEQLERARYDLEWMSIMRRVQIFVPFAVENLPSILNDAWVVPQAEGPQTHDNASGQERRTFMNPDRIVALRKWIMGHPLQPLDGVARHGHSLEELEQERVAHIEEKVKKPKERGSPKKRKRQAGIEVKDGQKLALDRKLVPAKRSRDALEDEQYHGLSLLRGHVAGQVTVGESLSTKMNYVLREVLEHNTDKFLIFSNSPLSLAHMGEALSLARISHLKIMSEVDPAKWSTHAMTFQSDDSCQCLLMELKYGARGLNLTRANRIIFLEPVWRADEESQAIKRAHRIGQVNPISIKILAVRETVEEAMIGRRRQFQANAGQQPKSMLDETGMRAYIENPTFLKVAMLATDPRPLRIPLLPAPQGDERMGEDEQLGHVDKRPRIVRFAD
ncbi:hypothetical protein AURDEDRAFT_81353 [Auricularia subglabra TFB-10046 SS5]|nr:hypothetical protein AURDEDRAFT_81353 [Auricularia subglabra TFB-10046 SS5]